MNPSRRTVMSGTLGAAAAAALPKATASATARRAAIDTATVTVNADQPLATAPATLVGANTAIYDALLGHATTVDLLAAAGIKYLRYPGGSHSDVYHWQSHTAENGAYIDPANTFDAFMTMVRGAGAQPIITVNYGSGTAQEAAEWVRHANVTKGYGVAYWEIGNEVFGNGHYGGAWEYDIHADKSPRAYGNAVLGFITAMKAVDPTIKIGIVLTAPGAWPDGIVGPGDSADWNDEVLSVVGGQADFAVFHWYPYEAGISEATMLARPQSAASTVAAFKADLAAHGASDAGIFVTEVNGGPPRDTQPQALWAADAYLALAEAGVENVTWWNVHNGYGGISTDSTGVTDYNDEGLISYGSTGEPPAHTPFRSYYGIQMISRVCSAGDTLVRATSSTSTLSAHAVRRTSGGLDLLLINKDPANACTVTLSYTGYRPSTRTVTDTYGPTSTAITRATSGSATSQIVPPYGLLAVHLTAS